MDKKILDYVTEQEDYYYDLAGKALVEGNYQANMMLIAQATAFQRVRYLIEELKESEMMNDGTQIGFNANRCTNCKNYNHNNKKIKPQGG